MANDKTAFKNLHLGQGASAASAGLGMSWKTITIAGTTGIMMGASGGLAGMVYATETDWSDDSNATDDVSPARHDVPSDEPGTADADVAVMPPLDLPLAVIDDCLSFGEAFAEARSQVGPGGVFDWHGHLYSTYYVEEWDAMSLDERIHFAQLVPVAQEGEMFPQSDFAELDNSLEADVQAVDDDVSEFSDDDVRILGIDDFDREAPQLFGMNDDTDDVSIIDLNDDLLSTDPDVMISPDEDLLVQDDVHIDDDIAAVGDLQQPDDAIMNDAPQEDQQEFTGDLSAFDFAYD